jgi:hypothetical protein
LFSNNDRNAEILGELPADDAGDDVARAARSVGNDEFDGARRVRLGTDVVDGGGDGEQSGERCKQPEFHDGPDRVTRAA